MNFLGRHTIATDVLVDRLSMLLIIAEGIEDLREGEVRQPPNNFFWGHTEFPQLGNRAHGRAGSCHDRSSAENILGADDVGMARGCGHIGGFRSGCATAEPTGGNARSQFEPFPTQAAALAKISASEKPNGTEVSAACWQA